MGKTYKDSKKKSTEFRKKPKGNAKDYEKTVRDFNWKKHKNDY